MTRNQALLTVLRSSLNWFFIFLQTPANKFQRLLNHLASYNHKTTLFWYQFSVLTSFPVTGQNTQRLQHKGEVYLAGVSSHVSKSLISELRSRRDILDLNKAKTLNCQWPGRTVQRAMPEKKGQGSRHRHPRSHSMTHSDISKNVSHQSQTWIPMPIKLAFQPNCHNDRRQ